MALALPLVLAVLLGAHVVVGLYNSTTPLILSGGFSAYPCNELPHFLTELEPSVMGQWYVVEIVQHPVQHPPDQHRQDNKHWSTNDHALICPKITLYQLNKRNLKMTWAEKEGDAVYSYELVDPENPGFWVASANPTGSSLNPNLKEFRGSTQVIEAHPDRLVLTFCQNKHSKHERKFSAILVRNVTSHNAMPHDTSGSRRRMADLGLSELSSRRTCEPGSWWEKGVASRTSLSVAVAVMCALLWASH